MRIVGVLSSLVLAAGAGSADVPRVAVDVAPLHGLVSQVMDGVGTPDLVIPPGASPHGYAMRPSEARALSAANVVVWIGPALTPWLAEPLETLAPDAQHLSVTQLEGTVLFPMREGARFEAHDHDHGHDDEHSDDNSDDHAKEHDHADDHVEKHDHAEEHGHADEHNADAAVIDPHLWLDPENAKVWLSAIAGKLSQIDPTNADTYRVNAETARLELDVLQQEIAQKMSKHAGKPFIVFHDAYHYFEARFGIEAVAAITLSNAEAASAARIAEVRDVVKDTDAVCALSEPRASAGLVAAVGEDTDLHLQSADAIGLSLELGTTYYSRLLMQISQAFDDCFKAKNGA